MNYINKIAFLSLFFTIIIFSQDNEIITSKADINAFGTPPSIDYTISFKNPIDPLKTRRELGTINFNLRRITDNSLITGTIIKKTAGEKFIQLILQVRDSSQTDIVKQIFSQDFPTYIEASEDINIYLPDMDNTITISKDQLKELTFSSKTLTDDKMEMLLQYLNGSSLEITNNINFSKEVNNKDTTSSEFILDFDIQKPLLSSLFSIPLFYELKGRLSTNEHNPLDIFSAYIKYKHKENFFFEMGRIGPQKLNTNSFRINCGYENIIPNLIDLTGGNPRLRLKPFIKFGAAYQYNFYKENPFGNDSGNLLVFMNGYYYVPVLDRFALVFECEGTYSDKLITEEKFLFNYSLSFGYETPLENLKILFRVVDGKNEINLGEATVYSIGMLLDYIPF